MKATLKKILLSSWVPLGFTSEYVRYFGQDASKVIEKELGSDKPSLICKIGYTELNCILSCTNSVARNFSKIKLILKLVTNAKKKISIKSGFFPVDKENIQKFAELQLSDMQQIDVLGSWLKHENYIENYLDQAVKIKASDIEPFFHENPWTKCLENKRVLVIHPFQDSIVAQYERRNELFENKDILPNFDLKTIRAVQSRENNNVKFTTWWEALDFLKGKIDETEFDIAILGCGSYSLPLGAYIKRKGKKAIHLGGGTQLLFGIKGSRWEERQKYRELFNESWIRPLPSDTPDNITAKDSYW